jgi:ring-1,2-phenylacetyl-CoA epoxidase subunit PaaB
MIRKYYYGDYDSIQTGSGNTSSTTTQNIVAEIDKNEFTLWEVFIRSKQGLDHKHVGSLHATDAKMAMENARDVYTRRMEGVSIWVVESKFIVANNPDDAEQFFEPATDKIYRHPTFYEIPNEVGHM